MASPWSSHFDFDFHSLGLVLGFKLRGEEEVKDGAEWIASTLRVIGSTYTGTLINLFRFNYKILIS